MIYYASNITLVEKLCHQFHLNLSESNENQDDGKRSVYELV
jgi:hypothetical protein